MTHRVEQIENILLNLGFIQRKLIHNAPSQVSMDFVKQMWTRDKGKLFAKWGMKAVTPSQLRVLLGVMKHNAAKKRGPTVKELAQALMVSSSAITQAIDGLVEKGYLIRETHSRDRRVTVILLSPQMQQKLTEFKKLFATQSAPLFEALTEEELMEYHRLNKKIVDAINNDAVNHAAVKNKELHLDDKSQPSQQAI